MNECECGECDGSIGNQHHQTANIHRFHNKYVRVIFLKRTKKNLVEMNIFFGICWLVFSIPRLKIFKKLFGNM